MAFTKNRADLEPSASEIVGTVDSAALLSLAISMKRIADAMTYQPTGGENLYDMLNAVRHNTVPHAR